MDGAFSAKKGFEHLYTVHIKTKGEFLPSVVLITKQTNEYLHQIIPAVSERLSNMFLHHELNNNILFWHLDVLFTEKSCSILYW